MQYHLKFSTKLTKDFKNISKADIAFIKDSLDEFANNFNQDYEKQLLKIQKIKKLKGQKEDIYRLKLRTYRAIYKKQDDKLVILVISVKSRGAVYK
ncbi:RelE/StbE replicon stabilization toxin [uncultured Candidatus Thioglobus sp.]|nr:RelE/StbE replicon stabilization toxin [uncultured Candidatus Thioglobus sp.]